MQSSAWRVPSFSDANWQSVRVQNHGSRRCSEHLPSDLDETRSSGVVVEDLQRLANYEDPCSQEIDEIEAGDLRDGWS